MAFHSVVQQAGKGACSPLRVPLLWGEISLKHGSGFAEIIGSPLQLLFSACTVGMPGYPSLEGLDITGLGYRHTQESVPP